MDLNLPVTLVIKAPNQKVEDLTVECGLTWTVEKLKQHLSNVYPSKPKHNEQRIIYSGQLLNDDGLTLKDILREHESGIHTVHLVCSQKSSLTSPSPHVTPPPTPSDNNARRRNTQATPSPVNHTQPQWPTYNPYTYYNGAHIYNPTAMASGQQFSPQQMTPQQMTQQQMMWMQQMYAQQQMVQYMQMMQPGTPPQQSPPPPVNNPVNANVPLQQAANPQPRVAEDIRMNAQGGLDPDDDDDEVNRDWLDWIYTICRFSVLMSVLYFYSTLSRFMAVTGLCVLVYVYQRGWFRFRLNRRNVEQRAPNIPPRRVPEAPQGEPQVQQPAENGSGAEDNMDGSSEAAEDQSEPVPEQPPPPNILTVTLTFIKTFFSSLVPENPRGVNAN